MVGIVELMEKGYKISVLLCGTDFIVFRNQDLYGGKIQSKGWCVVFGNPAALGHFKLFRLGAVIDHIRFIDDFVQARAL